MFLLITDKYVFLGNFNTRQPITKSSRCGLEVDRPLHIQMRVVTYASVDQTLLGACLYGTVYGPAICMLLDCDIQSELLNIVFLYSFVYTIPLIFL